MSTDIQEVEVKLSLRILEKALEFVKHNVPEEKLDEFKLYMESLLESAKSGERINVGDVVADLLDPKKFGLPTEVVESFVQQLVDSEPSPEKYVSGTLEYAKRKIWKKHAPQ